MPAGSVSGSVMDRLRCSGLDRSAVWDDDGGDGGGGGWVPIEVPAGAPVVVKDLVRAVEEAAGVDFGDLFALTLKELCEVFNRLRCAVAGLVALTDLAACPRFRLRLRGCKNLCVSGVSDKTWLDG